MTRLNILVIGYGSMGRRHAKIMCELGHSVTVVTKQEIADQVCVTSIRDVEGIEDYSYAVVATSPGSHISYLRAIIESGFTGKILVEKPLSITPVSLQIPENIECFVGYNLRFHNGLLRLSELLAREAVLSARAYVGSYLPEWRPDRDYRSVISSSSREEGGVVRELSHELDYLGWLFGKLNVRSAVLGKLSGLEIEAEDLLQLMASAERCPAISLELNYFDRIGRRELYVNGESESYQLDFIRGTLKIGDTEIRNDVDRDSTIISMHEAVLYGNGKRCCSLYEGMAVLDLIDTIYRQAERIHC